MMGRLHVASWLLLLGVLGQVALYSSLAPRIPLWVVFAALLPPWLTVYTISFCRQAPFGPRRFRHCLIFAMSWYAAMTLAAETPHMFFHIAPSGHLSTTAARVLTYLGALSFIVFIRTRVLLRRYETSTPNFPVPFSET
jgi:hypothetical protein